jgi:Temperature dependent protein affecting M2 dsRNA replication
MRASHLQPAYADPPLLHRFLLNTHTHSALARAMHTAIKQAKLNDKFQDPLYLFLELVRAGVMHGHLWSGRAFSGGPSFGGGELFATLEIILLPSSFSCVSLFLLSWRDRGQLCDWRRIFFLRPACYLPFSACFVFSVGFVPSMFSRLVSFRAQGVLRS